METRGILVFTSPFLELELLTQKKFGIIGSPKKTLKQQVVVILQMFDTRSVENVVFEFNKWPNSL